jgi:hypothetical protein
MLESLAFTIDSLEVTGGSGSTIAGSQYCIGGNISEIGTAASFPEADIPLISG